MPDDSPFPELNELREKLQRLEGQSRAEARNVFEIELRIEAEKKQREAAMKDAFADGTSPSGVEDNREALEKELAAAKERSSAAWQAVVDYINHSVAFVVEHRPEWLGLIKQHESDIDVQIAELEAQLLATVARKGSFFKLEHWLDRTAQGAEFGPSHFPYSDIVAPPSDDPLVKAAEQRRLMEESYAGGLPGATKTSDAAGRQREADHVPSGGVGQTMDQSSGKTAATQAAEELAEAARITPGVPSGDAHDAVSEIARVKQSGVLS
jgi:hypothetical protein